MIGYIKFNVHSIWKDSIHIILTYIYFLFILQPTFESKHNICFCDFYFLQKSLSNHNPDENCYLNAQTLTPTGLRMNYDRSSMTLHRVLAFWLSVLICEMWIIIIMFNSLMLPGLNEFIRLTCLRQCLAYSKINMTNIYFIAFTLSLFSCLNYFFILV